MYIKKLVMKGFKSFPKKTEIPFMPGINVILGPNGSGKSNISDAICFVLGRLSVKSMRVAKAKNLIFMGTKAASPSKEASVELVFDNSNKTFSLDKKEISIKRIVRKSGQSIYKINDEKKTRQEVLALLAQAGIDPQGFNIVLQGEIQNFVRMHSEERRQVIEEVSGISVYESKKQKSQRELEKTEEKLKSVNSVLRERTSYLNNLEKERRQALKYKKLKEDVKRLKASIIFYGLKKKRKESKLINKKMQEKDSALEKTKKSLADIETDIKNLKAKADKINSQIQGSAGVEQERLNQEIANLRAELSGINVKLENQETKHNNLSKQKQELREAIKKAEKSINELQRESKEALTEKKKSQEVEEKKKILEEIDEQRKKFYMTKSKLSSLKERIRDKEISLKNYNNEADSLVRQSEEISLEIFDPKSNRKRLDKLKTLFAEKKEALSRLLKREIELEKTTSVNESEIENHKKILGKVSKLDVCPVCKSKITPEHLKEIENEFLPKIKKLEKEVQDSDRELKIIYQKKEILTKDIEQLTEKISRTESDISKIKSMNEKKSQIKKLKEKSEEVEKELVELIKKREKFEKILEASSNIETKYETLKIEIQEISSRTKENLSSEVDFKKREFERLKISLKQAVIDDEEVKEEVESLKKIVEEKEKALTEKRRQEEILSQKFKKFISERDSIYSQVREKESEVLEQQHKIRMTEDEINELKIDRARVDAETENLETEMLEFEDVRDKIIKKKSKESLSEKLAKVQDILSRIGSVNLRSLEVYDSIKKEYDSIKEKAEIISKEKEGILKIIEEIDKKKKRAFLKTMKTLNELFSRNFSQLSIKGHVFLELENKKDPFEHGSGVQIIVKTGHGKYFDVKSLSGGEQTLVALSLIFAIQEYSPYYFYLLDEIDAALDKKNSERLAGLLNKYMQKGQYIVITHNDEIISKATNLYGISMHDGISKIVSLKV